jgi:hypothetical protein
LQTKFFSRDESYCCTRDHFDTRGGIGVAPVLVRFHSIVIRSQHEMGLLAHAGVAFLFRIHQRRDHPESEL